MEMELFIRQLQHTPEERKLECPSQISTEEFQSVFKIQKEDTSSSYSGVHYTLWKAIAEKSELAEVHALWASLPFMYGFVCERWRKEIDCTLEKKPGVRKIHILWIIGLMEGDFNAMLTYHAEHRVSRYKPKSAGGKEREECNHMSIPKTPDLGVLPIHKRDDCSLSRRPPIKF
jgi:hypothetical protein